MFLFFARARYCNTTQQYVVHTVNGICANFHECNVELEGECEVVTSTSSLIAGNFAQIGNSPGCFVDPDTGATFFNNQVNIGTGRFVAVLGRRVPVAFWLPALSVELSVS